MTIEEPVRFKGMPGSPYTRKMLAYLRYRHIRYELLIDGQPWPQHPFPYQAKWLQWINDEHAKLNGRDRQRVSAILAGTGCEALLDPGQAR